MGANTIKGTFAKLAPVEVRISAGYPYRSQTLADAVMSTPMPIIASPISKSAGLWLKR
jgi:hypothetical protein